MVELPFGSTKEVLVASMQASQPLFRPAWRVTLSGPSQIIQTSSTPPLEIPQRY
jgi:hypothetical protein